MSDSFPIRYLVCGYVSERYNLDLKEGIDIHCMVLTSDGHYIDIVQFVTGQSYKQICYN